MDQEHVKIINLKKKILFFNALFSRKKPFDCAIVSASLNIQKNSSGLGVVTCDVKVWSARMLFRDPAYVLRASTVVMEAEESENDRSSDGNSVLDLSYSSSSFEGSIGGEDSDTTDNGMQ